MTSATHVNLASVAEVFADVTDVPETDVQLDKHLVDDLEVDSLSMAELGVALQERFGVELPDEQIVGLVTVADVLDAIRGAQVPA